MLWDIYVSVCFTGNCIFWMDDAEMSIPCSEWEHITHMKMFLSPYDYFTCILKEEIPMPVNVTRSSYHKAFQDKDEGSPRFSGIPSLYHTPTFEFSPFEFLLTSLNQMKNYCLSVHN